LLTDTVSTSFHYSPSSSAATKRDIEKKTAKLQGSERSVVARLEAGHAVVGTAVASHAAKKFLKSFQLGDLPKVDCLPITQSLDDHCHLKMLQTFS